MIFLRSDFLEGDCWGRGDCNFSDSSFSKFNFFWSGSFLGRCFFVLADAVYAPPGFTREEMKKLRKQALTRFYFRPKIMLGFIAEIRSFGHLKLVLVRAYSWLFKAK